MEQNITPIKYLFKSMKETFAGIKIVLKKPSILLPGIVVSIIWFVLSYLVANGQSSNAIYILSIITFAQGGMYGGIIGAIGGIIGKAILSIVITKMFFKPKKLVKEKIKSNSFISGLMGVSIGMIIYNFLSGNASLENACIGIVLFFIVNKKSKETSSFLYEFLPTFSKNITKETVKSLFVGLNLGLISAVMISCIKIGSNFIPYIIGISLLVMSVIIKLLKRKSRICVIIILFFIMFISLENTIYAKTLPLTGTVFNGMKLTYDVSNATFSKTEILKKTENNYSEKVTGTCSNGNVKISVNFNPASGMYKNGSPTASLTYHNMGKGSEYQNVNLNSESMIDKNGYLSVLASVDEEDEYITFDISFSQKQNNKQYNESLQIVLWNNDYNKGVIKQENKTEQKSVMGQEIEKNENVVDGEHANLEETILISAIAAAIAALSAILGIGIGPLQGEKAEDLNDDNYIVIRDPVSGAETGYKKNTETNEWISLDGSTILDSDKVIDWMNQRKNDKDWINKQNEKIRVGDTQLGKKLKDISDKEKEDLKKMQEDSEKEQKRIRDEWYQRIKQDVIQEEKMANVWKKQENIFRTAEIVAEITSVVAESAIDIYGHINPKFTKGYKIIKNGLSGAAEKGWSGLAEGTIKGIADAMLVGSELNSKNKALVRFGSRVWASKVGSIIREEDSTQSFNSLTDGVIDGVLHAGTGFAMEKLTGNASKFKNRFIDPVKNWTTKNHVTSDTLNELIGMKNGGLQRVSVRLTRDFAVKPYVTNKIKQNKNEIF